MASTAVEQPGVAVSGGQVLPTARRRSRLPIDEFAVVVLTLAVTLSALHVLFPALAGYAERNSDQQAGALVLLIFTPPFLTTVFRKLTGKWALLIAVLALAVWRVVVLASRTIPLAMAIGGVIVGLVALTLVLTSDRFSGVLALGVVGGFAFDVLSRSLFATWDPVWQRSFPALAFGIGVAVALAIGARSSLPTDLKGDEAGNHLGGLLAGVAVGALMVLEVLFLSSVGFVASSAGVILPVAVVIVVVGLAVACPLASRGGASRRRVVLAGLGLASIGATLPVADGAMWIAMLVIGGQALAAIVLSVALARPAGHSRTQAEIGLAIGWLVFAFFVLLYQVHFDQPLPFDNRWVIAIAGSLTTLAAIGGLIAIANTPDRVSLRREGAELASFVLGAAALVALVLATTGTTAAVRPAPRPLTVVQWNVRQAVTDDGQLDPESVAQVLERGGSPDVVVLAEAARGWPMSGDLDLASWLSRRLGLSFVWGGAADNQFGNVILSRLPILNSSVIMLPAAGDAQGRSLVRAQLDLGSGPPLTVLATHLQNRNDAESMTARMAELDEIVREWGGAPRTILIGDLNPRQGDPPAFPPRTPREFEEIRVILDAGFTTAQDLERCDRPTSNRNCSDFIFVTPDLQETRFDVLPASVSDHRPVATSIEEAL